MVGAGGLAGLTAFITGGAGGIGSAAAEVLLRDGATVVLMGRRRDKLEETRGRLLAQTQGGQVEIYAGDAMNEEDLKAALAQAAAITGRIDILFPTVGGATAFGPLATVDLDAFRTDYERNVMSAVLALRHAAPYMKNGGSAVFISSTAGLNSFRYLAGYAAAKAALEHFVKTAADELGADGIRVNGVRAGMTRTPDTESFFESDDLMATYDGLVPLGRLGAPYDIAAAVRYIAGPESAWMTGEFISVDGGQHLRHNPDFAAMFAGQG